MIDQKEIPLSLSYNKETKRFSLWGMAGGQLEFVSKRIETIENQIHVILRFTDHDTQAVKDFQELKELVKGEFYEIEIPIADYDHID